MGGELYGYGHTNVLFKPTKAAEFPFRPTGAEAMSYFVGCDAIQDGYKEDGGFAINGGKGWKDVVFTNHQVDCHGEVAIAMGSYVFTCATTNVRPRLSTPSATSATTTATCASASTTRRSPTAPKRIVACVPCSLYGHETELL